jgi:hypothetical protein
MTGWLHYSVFRARWQHGHCKVLRQAGNIALLFHFGRKQGSPYRTLEQHAPAADQSSGAQNAVVFKKTGEPYWCHLVFHPSL